MSIERQNILIIGAGGREDALAWKLRQSRHAGDIFIAPGNGGTERFPDTHAVSLNLKNTGEIVGAARDLKVDLAVVGSEDPLIAGLADKLREANIPTYGPGGTGAALEGSKAEAVYFMRHHGIPHPDSTVLDDYDMALKFLTFFWPKVGGVVVKADGPCTGKGVTVCETKEEAEDALTRMMRDNEFGEAGKRVVIQERLTGYEVSVMAIVSGGSYILLPFAQDHKQVFVGGRGPNTGGMGAVAPHPYVTETLAARIENEIIRPTLRGLLKQGIDFRGTLYPGIMITPDGPKVLEYNVRFGDPETEAILPILEGDFLKTLLAASLGNSEFNRKYPYNTNFCTVITLASAGYPGKHEKGKKIYGLESQSDMHNVIIFHAGTAADAGEVYTAGGRVLMVAGLGESIEKSRKEAYGAIGEGKIFFEGMHFRTDIGIRRNHP